MGKMLAETAIFHGLRWWKFWFPFWPETYVLWRRYDLFIIIIISPPPRAWGVHNCISLCWCEHVGFLYCAHMFISLYLVIVVETREVSSRRCNYIFTMILQSIIMSCKINSIVINAIFIISGAMNLYYVFFYQKYKRKISPSILQNDCLYR